MILPTVRFGASRGTVFHGRPGPFTLGRRTYCKPGAGVPCRTGNLCGHYRRTLYRPPPPPDHGYPKSLACSKLKASGVFGCSGTRSHEGG